MVRSRSREPLLTGHGYSPAITKVLNRAPPVASGAQLVSVLPVDTCSLGPPDGSGGGAGSFVRRPLKGAAADRLAPSAPVIVPATIAPPEGPAPVWGTRI
jgi:hypothetical protein